MKPGPLFHAPLSTVLAALLLASCGGDGGESGWSIAADSVDGVARIVNSPPESAPLATLVAEEELRIGTFEGAGPSSFGMIRSIAVLPDGRLAVADGQAEEVRLFARDGAHLRTFGGKGAGPGELEGMQGVHVDHEGMLRVAEYRNARLSVFHPDTGYVTSHPLRLHTYGARGPWGAVMDSSGRSVVASSGQYGEGRFWNMLRVYDAAMNQLDSIPYHEYTGVIHEDQPGAWRVDIGNGGFTWAPVPFYSRSYEVLAPTGELWSSAEGRPQLEVARWTPPEDTSLVLVSRRQPDPVTAVERDSAMEALREGLAQRVPTPPSLDASRVPARKPPLYGLSLDDRGRLWVRLTDPAVDSTVYDLFDRDGSHAETVRLPFRVDRYVPPVVHGDTLWAVLTDELDVQYVLRARLRPSAEGISGQDGAAAPDLGMRDDYGVEQGSGTDRHEGLERTKDHEENIKHFSRLPGAAGMLSQIGRPTASFAPTRPSPPVRMTEKRGMPAAHGARGPT